MTVLGLLALSMLVMKCWPETASARWLQRHLVDYPRAVICGIERRHIIFFFVATLLLISFAEIGAPELATLMAIDVSAYVDALITVWTIAALARSKGAWMALRARLPDMRRRGQVRRSRQRTRPMAERRAANDDEDAGSRRVA